VRLTNSYKDLRNSSVIASMISFVTLLFFTGVIKIYGQYDVKDFVHYTIHEGLSDNNISCIAQDNRGFIWIGTDFGLNRYDGFQFEKYYQDSPAGFLTSSRIMELTNFKNHRLAVSTLNGLQVINTNDFTITQIAIQDTTPFRVRLNSFIGAREFSDGTIGTLTATGFYVFDSTATLIYRFDAFGEKDVGNRRVLYGKKIIALPGDQAFIYATEDRQALYDIQKRSFREVSNAEKELEKLSQPTFLGWRSIAQMNENEIFFLTRTNLLIYYNQSRDQQIESDMPARFNINLSWESNVFMVDDSTYFVNGGYYGFYIFYFNKATGQVRYDDQVYLKEYKVRCFYKDKDNRIWIGTTEGLLKQKSSPVFSQIYHWPVQDISRLGYTNGFHYKDKLYFSRFSRDTGLVVVDAQSMQVRNKFSFYGKDNPANEVFTMQMYYADTLWLGTNAGLLWFDTKSGHYGKVDEILTQGVKALWTTLTSIQKDQFVWMCDLLGGNVAKYHVPSRRFVFFDKQSQPALPFSQVKSLVTDAFGDIWIGGHALARWNNLTQDFDLLITSYGGPNPYEDDIKLLRADQQGSLWLHNLGNGLLQFQIQSHTWSHFGMKEGLPSEVIQSMSIVHNHTLWLTCQNQLIRFDTETKKIETYDQTDGVPDIKPLSGNMYFDSLTQDLYVFYNNHVLSLPFDYHQASMTDNELFIQKVDVNNVRSFFFPLQELNLGTKENNLAIHFTLVDFHEGEPYRFAYRMDPKADWTNLGYQRTLHLTNLAAGMYTVEIGATSKSGIMKTKTLSFSIAPPFWATTWFIMLCIFVASMTIYLIYRLRIKQYQQKANLDKLLSQTEMKALHAQMNPHFIFNSLNSIREMILNNETREASRFLGDFAQLIRITLDQSRQSFISLRNTMDYLHRYIEMEKIRNPDFHFSMEADQALEPDETILPPMLIQPFIENAIWHGMNGEEREINIRVQFKKNNNQLVCIIEDDGIGIHQALKMKNEKNSGHQSVSIANIKKRIELLNQKHDFHSSISIEDKNTQEGHSGTGTIIRITLPLELTEA